ncbi:unnamed protein product, partial [marine sediment metagenome]
MGVEPVPIHEKIVDENGIMTIAFVRFLNAVRGTTSGGRSLSDLQKELDDTQTGAGLNPNGTYPANTDANYIKSATSLTDADNILDIAASCQIFTVTTDYDSDPLINQNVLCDATSGTLTVTLPDPALFYNSVTLCSKKIAITKIDTTTNIITINPFASELIVGEASQDLQVDG